MYLYPNILGYDKSAFVRMRTALGEAGAFGVTIEYPGFQNWFSLVQNGIEALTFAYYDHHELIEAWRELEHRRCIRMMELILDARPDFVLLGGSGSITLYPGRKPFQVG